MGDTLLIDIRGEDMVCSTGKASSGCLSTPGMELRLYWTIGWGILLNENDAVNDFMTLHPRESMLSVSSPDVSSSVSLSEQALLMLHKFIHDSPMYDPIVVKY